MSGPGPFEKARVDELPPMLDGPNGRGCAAALGRAQDQEIALAVDAVLMRYPLRTPDDALDLKGAESNLPRLPGEPTGTATSGYRGRVVGRWDTWKLASTGPGIEASLHSYGIPDATVYAWEDFPSAEKWWSKIYLFLGPDFGATGIGEQIWDAMSVWELPNATWESTATPAQITQIKRQFLKWKWAYALPVEIVLLFNGTNITAISPIGLPTFTGAPPCLWRMTNLWDHPSVIWDQFVWQNAIWQEG